MNILNRVLIAVTLIVLATASAHAAIFTVTNTSDSGAGSLRKAIVDANASAGLDTVAFNIPGVGPHTIQPLSALPTITDPVVIDGYTQSGASPNTNGPGQGLNTVLKIELDGTNAGASANGLRVTAGGSTVRGLVINRFNLSGLVLESNGGNLIEGNLIGTDVAGTADLGNSSHGITVDFSPDNMIGGTAAEARNVISGNGFFGIAIRFGSTENWVQGNFIGTDITGTVDLGNTSVGVGTSESNTTIGGTAAGARNVISGNGGAGVQLSGVGRGVAGSVIQGNFIGTDITGTVDLGNTSFGVSIFDNANTMIGGVASGAGNTIAFNGNDGVFITTMGSVRNAILSNAMFSNTGLGIDLDPGGVTPNDVGDGDVGPNNLQNFPVLTSATSGSTSIEGTLNSTPSTEFRLEFFSNTACDPSGNGEGESFVGSTDVTTDGSGNVSFMVTFPVAVPVGQFITATATDSDNNTSEFSLCLETASGNGTGRVDIDIKPGKKRDKPNPLDPNSNGKIQVAILSTFEFDALQVDQTTIGFGPQEAAAATCEVKDPNKDGLPDLSCKFKISETGIACGDTVATLIGVTFGGDAIIGTDAIKTVGCP